MQPRGGNKQFGQIDSVQNKAMKFFLGPQKTASTAAVYCDMDGHYVM